MICARCNRKIITAAVTLAGTPFGPRCAAKMGLMSLVQRPQKTQQRAIKGKSNTPVSNRSIPVQNGQQPLFEGLTV